MARQSDIKVIVRTPAGQYLTGNPGNWTFTSDRYQALVFDLIAHRVTELLESIRQSTGIDLELVPVPMQQIYEACDECEEIAWPWMTYFDGQHFLCPKCKDRPPTAESARPQAPE